MPIVLADFDETFLEKPNNTEMHISTDFIGSYPPVTPPGQMGPFFVNTYYLQPNRKMELFGTVPVRST